MTTTTTTNEPPEWMRPYIQDYLKRSQDVANTPYTQSPSRYVGPNQVLQNSWQAAYDNTKNPLVQNASTQLQNTINGQYLNGNPYLNSQIKAAQGDLVKSWNDVAKPSWDNKMAASGSFGNAGVMQAGANAQDTLQENLGRIASDMRFQAYNTERGNMMMALGLMPNYNNVNLNNINALNNAGQQVQTFDQNQANQNFDWFQEAKNYPREQLDIMRTAITGNPSSTQTTTTPGPSRTSRIVGGGLTGGALYDAYKEDFKNWWQGY